MVLQLVSSPLLSLIPRGLRVLRVLPAADHVTIEAEPMPVYGGMPDMWISLLARPQQLRAQAS